MEASALTHAGRYGLLGRPIRFLRLQKDDRLVALIRAGHDRAFEVLFERYHARLLAFSQHMLGSREDAEDVLQEVFVNAHNAMLGDDREINVRPWLYRIARNRCLNHLRKPVPEGQDSMDVHMHENGTSTAEQVQSREEFRHLLADVHTLPETQRTALLLREVDALCYEEIAQAMGTTVPSVKSLLVRARITLAEASQARLLTCGEVQLELAEAAEGLKKASGPVRQHVRGCEPCQSFRDQLRSDRRALAAAFAPFGLVGLVKEAIAAKLGWLGGSSAGGAATGGAATGGATATSAVTGASIGGATAGGAAGGVGAIGGAIGAKAAASVASVALLTAGAVEVKHYVGRDSAQQATVAPRVAPPEGGAATAAHGSREVARTPDREAKDATATAAATETSEPAAEPIVPSQQSAVAPPAAPGEQNAEASGATAPADANQEEEEESVAGTSSGTSTEDDGTTTVPTGANTTEEEEEAPEDGGQSAEPSEGPLPFASPLSQTGPAS